MLWGWAWLAAFNEIERSQADRHAGSLPVACVSPGAPPHLQYAPIAHAGLPETWTDDRAMLAVLVLQLEAS